MKLFNRMFVVFCLLFILSIDTFAQDKPEFSLTADYFGKYVWRGQNLNDDPVFQPGFSASYKGFTAGIWGNLETTDIHDSSGDFTEADYYIGYSGTMPGIEKLGYSLGAIYYDFPNTTVPSTTELYWGLSMDVFLSPSITFYHDIDEADGLYVSAGIGYSVEDIFKLGLETPVSLELGASYGWANGSYNEYYWGIDDSKANDISLSAALPFEVGGWSIKPGIKYVVLASGDIKDTDFYGTDDDLFFVGIGFSKGF
ncbi:MAG: hypothetical protein JW787_18775 [Sedimentisphaerales bacterium]|nr:hypothetical protein [Sedimentisphaerales bacterium]